MKITKIGHCCLIIETKGKKIMTDPGMFTVESHSKETGIDYILYTHEHGDHYHLDSLKQLLQGNPNAKVYCNTSVSDLLEKEGIDHTKISDGKTIMLNDIAITGIGEKHAIMATQIPASENTGFFIDGRLWYPGDAFTDPRRSIEIMALPTAGPWMKMSEAIDYALALKPQKVFSVHDGIIVKEFRPFISNNLKRFLEPQNIEVVQLNDGDTAEF